MKSLRVYEAGLRDIIEGTRLEVYAPFPGRVPRKVVDEKPVRYSARR